MMLAVMDLHRRRVDAGLQAAVVIRQLGYAESHGYDRSEACS